MKKNLIFLLKILIGATFFVPLIVIPDAFVFPFIVPKIIVFRSLALLLLAITLLLYFINREEFRPRFSWLSIAVLVYAISLLLSTFLGVDWYNSFWDTHERMLGTFTIFHYIVYYFILSTTIKAPEDWRKLQWWFLIAGSLVMSVGFLQRLSPDLLLNAGSWRVIATLGNAIYVGGYGLFLVFLGYIIGIREKERSKRLIAFFCSFLGFVGIFVSGTRGTMLGLFGSVGLLFLLYLICLKGYPKVRRNIAALMVLGIVVLSTLYINKNSSFVQNIPSLSRLFSISLSEQTGSTRVMAWGIAYQSFKEYPLVGWGPNNFYYAFNQYYRPEFMFFGLGETWFDNAHNVVMNTLSTGGLLGIVAYVGLFGAAIYQLVVAYRHKRVDIHIVIGGISLLVGHFIHNIFVFENPTSFLYFFFLLAYITSVTRIPQEEKGISSVKDRSLTPIVKFGIPLIILIFIYRTDINVARANNTTLNAMRYLSQGQVVPAFEMYNKAKTFSSPHIADIRNDFVRMGSQLIQNGLASQKVNDALKQVFQKLYEEQKINHAFRPMDIRVHILQAQMDILGNLLTQETRYIDDAEFLINDAFEFSPKRQQLYFLASTIQVQKGSFDEAIKFARQSVELDTRIGESWIHLALVYAQTNQTKKIPEIFKEAQDRGVVFTEDNKIVIQRSFGITLP